MNSPLPCCLLIAIVTLGSGCGARLKTDYGPLGLVDVSGTVTLDGAPLAAAEVRFEATDGTYSVGITDASGRYRLMFNSEKHGVVPGDKIVRIRMVRSDNDGENAPGEGQFVEPITEMVPACYHIRSQLRTRVERSMRNCDFALQSDCSARGPTNDSR